LDKQINKSDDNLVVLIPLKHIYDEFNTMNQSLSLLHMLKYHFTVIHYYDNAEAEGSLRTAYAIIFLH